MSITPLMRSILVLSHNPNLRAAARRALERAGCVVATAAHGGQATLALAWGDIEVLVVENELPEGSGKTVATRLRRHCPGLAVVVMCDRRSIVPADEIALVRPFTADDLLDGIMNAAARQALRGATSL
jgi:DNA-binding NtrC family response regulator